MRQNTIVLISHQKHVLGDVYGEGWPTLEPFWGGSCKMKPEEHPTLTPPQVSFWVVLIEKSMAQVYLVV